MKRILVVPAALLLLSALQAQNRAVMEPPIIKGTTDEVSFSARFSMLNPEKVYHIAVGTGGGSLDGATIALESGGNPVDLKLMDFTQKYTASWWGVPEVEARGFLIEGASIPSEGELTLKFSISRAKADSLKKIYVFVAKQYGPNTWYLEDGTELSDEYW